MKKNHFLLISIFSLSSLFTGCSVVKHYKLAKQSNNMRNIWAKNMIDLMGKKFKNKNYNISFEVLSQRFFQGVAYDASYEYTEALNFNMEDEWAIVKKLYKDNYIKSEWFDDPYGLNSFYNKFPNNTPKLSLVSQDVIKDKESYEKFKKWFKLRVIDR